MPSKTKKLLTVKSEPGYATTEFWTTLLGDLAALVAVLFHGRFSGFESSIPVIAVAAAFIGHVVYVWKRSNHKTQALLGLLTALGGEIKPLLEADEK